MAYNLKNFAFGKSDDVLEVEEGIVLAGYNTVDTLGGNDVIHGIGNEGVVGIGPASTLPQAGITLSPVLPILRMATGSDSLIGEGGDGGSVLDPDPDPGQDGASGILNEGLIDLGSGRGDPELIRGVGGDGGDGGFDGFDGGEGGDGGSGIQNKGTILTGNAADQILGIGGAAGSGGTGEVHGAGGGATSGSDGSAGYGIVNTSTGRIATNGGDDTITGTSASSPGIWNDGIIEMGRGNDRLIAESLDADVIDFIGSGYVSLGSGSDLVQGFGSGKFDGGSGLDRLIIDEQKYAGVHFFLSSEVNTNGYYELNAPTLSDRVMELRGFEEINGIKFDQILSNGGFSL